jgi:hypothetical protein
MQAPGQAWVKQCSGNCADLTATPLKPAFAGGKAACLSHFEAEAPQVWRRERARRALDSGRCRTEQDGIVGRDRRTDHLVLGQGMASSRFPVLVKGTPRPTMALRPLSANGHGSRGFDVLVSK